MVSMQLLLGIFAVMFSNGFSGPLHSVFKDFGTSLVNSVV